MPKVQWKIGRNRSSLVYPSHFCFIFQSQCLCVLSLSNSKTIQKRIGFYFLCLFFYTSYFGSVLHYKLQTSFFPLKPDSRPVCRENLWWHNFVTKFQIPNEKTRRKTESSDFAKPRAAARFLVLVWLGSIFIKAAGPRGDARRRPYQHY